MHDLIIIGAGPVGSYLASLCSANMNVLVLEQKMVPGNKACSGLVSHRIKEILPKKIIDARGVIQHSVKGARIHIFGQVIELRKKETAAYVINRDLLDKKLSEYAESCGCEIKFQTRAEKISVLKDSVELKTSKGVFESQMVAGCDGANSVAARYIGAKPAELLNGLILYVDKEDRSDYVEMWFDRAKASSGFFWKIPRGSKTEYGAMGKGINFSALEKFFGLENKKIVKKSAAPIPIGLVRTFSDRLLLAGDSACQTKPWSGGGVTYGLLAARIASKVIINSVEKNKFCGKALSQYEDEWKKLLLKDIQAGLMFRELYKDLPESEMKILMEKFSAMKIFEQNVDFDFPFSSFFPTFPTWPHRV